MNENLDEIEFVGIYVLSIHPKNKGTYLTNSKIVYYFDDISYANYYMRNCCSNDFVNTTNIEIPRKLYQLLLSNNMIKKPERAYEHIIIFSQKQNPFGREKCFTSDFTFIKLNNPSFLGNHKFNMIYANKAEESKTYFYLYTRKKIDTHGAERFLRKVKENVGVM